MTAVSPSPTSSCVSACWVWNVKPMSTGAVCTLERSACTSIRTCRFDVTWGVTFRLMPVCSKVTVARGTPVPPAEGELTSTIRIGTRSPTRIWAGRLSSTVTDGSACTSVSWMRSSADRKVVRSKLPSAVEKISSSAGLTIAPPALPSADRELPPRSTIVLSGENVSVGTSASGTPSRSVSTGFALAGSNRCTKRLKN